MFNKLVKNLPFNPGLIEQVGFYSKRLNQETVIRRFGFGFLVFALLAQLFVAMYPAEQSLASSSNHILNGVSDRASVLAAWDNNTGNVRAIYRKFGVSRDNLASMTASPSVNIKSSGADYWTIGRLPLSNFGISGDQWGERKISAEGNIIYQRPLKAWDRGGAANSYSAFKGTNDRGVTFWILKDCGNLTFGSPYLPSPPQPKLEVHKSLITPSKVKPGDTVKFRLEYRNPVNDSLAANFKLVDSLNSNFEYQSLSGVSNRDGNTLTIARPGGLGYSSSFNTETLAVKVKSGVKPGTQICNQATASSKETGSKLSEKVCVTVVESVTEQVCGDLESGKINVSGDRTSMAFTAPSGKLVARYCVKAGSANQNLGPEYTEVKPPAKMVTLKHSSGKAISHYSYALVNEAIPSPPPNPQPTPPPSPNPTPPPAPTPVPPPASCYCVSSAQVISGTNNVEVTTEAFAQNGKITAYLYDLGADGKIDFTDETGEAVHKRTFSNLASGEYTLMVKVRVKEASSGKVKELADCQVSFKLAEEPRVTVSKTAKNITSNQADANGTTVKPSDELEFRLITENVTTSDYKNYAGEDYIGDVLEYADLTNLEALKAAGVSLDANKYLRWTTTVKAKSSDVKTLLFKVKQTLPVTNQPAGANQDFDCKISNRYGNEVVMNVGCPLIKSIEQATGKLPNTGPGLPVAVAFAVSSLAGYFFFRSRLLAKEMAVVKNDYSSAGGF